MTDTDLIAEAKETARAILAHMAIGPRDAHRIEALAEALESRSAEVSAQVWSALEVLVPQTLQRIAELEAEVSALREVIEKAKNWEGYRNAFAFGEPGTAYSNGAQAAHRSIAAILTAVPAVASPETKGDN